jgi:hypothetical protein
MDELRARAYLDLLLGKDSRPRHGNADGGGDGGSGGPGPGDSDAPPPSAVPAGFAGRVTLTVPLATITGLADRPGELAGLGPIDPWLARDLATAATANPKSTWCVTVTDGHGHAIGHGCARPEPGTTGNARGQGRRGSPSPRPAGTGRLTDTAPGGCTPPEMGRTCWSPSTRSPPGTATTGLKAGPTIRASGSGTCPRSGTPPAPARSAGGPPADAPADATSSTTRHTKRADERASVMAALSVATTTGSSSTPSGRSTSSPTAPSAGPLPPGVPTPPNQRGTPSEGPRPWLRTLASLRGRGGRPAGRPGRRAPG